MCNDCLTKGLWEHEEKQQFDRFVNGFSARKKKPSYRSAAQPKKPDPEDPIVESSPPEAAAASSPVEQPQPEATQ
jgi:hypothetical protein